MSYFMSFLLHVSHLPLHDLNPLSSAFSSNRVRGGRKRKTMKLSRDLSNLVVFTNSVASQECLNEGESTKQCHRSTHKQSRMAQLIKNHLKSLDPDLYLDLHTDIIAHTEISCMFLFFLSRSLKYSVRNQEKIQKALYCNVKILDKGCSPTHMSIFPPSNKHVAVFTLKTLSHARPSVLLRYSR